MHMELLRLAFKLGDDRDGYPRWVARHRAVSTAYYALFHAVAEVCATTLVSRQRSPWDAYRRIYRSLDHGQAKRVFVKLRNDALFRQQAKEVAIIFVELQQERHGADYDPGHEISLSESKAILTRAKHACELVFQIPRDERKLLAAQLIGRDRG